MEKTILLFEKSSKPEHVKGAEMYGRTVYFLGFIVAHISQIQENKFLIQNNEKLSETVNVEVNQTPCSPWFDFEKITLNGWLKNMYMVLYCLQEDQKSKDEGLFLFEVSEMLWDLSSVYAREYEILEGKKELYLD